MAPQKQAESTPAPEPAAPDSAAAVVEAPAPVPEVLPNNALTGDMLFRITKAELEFKQGQWQGAYVTMLSLAQQTRDPRLARRAAEMALAAKQGQEALAAIRLWRELAPESDEATQYFLGFAVVNDDLSEAEAIFAQRLKAARRARRGSRVCWASDSIVIYAPCHCPCLNSSSALVMRNSMSPVRALLGSTSGTGAGASATAVALSGAAGSGAAADSACFCGAMAHADSKAERVTMAKAFFKGRSWVGNGQLILRATHRLRVLTSVTKYFAPARLGRLNRLDIAGSARNAGPI